MKSIQDLITKYEVKKPRLNERQTILKEIYELYLGDVASRKKENWVRFCKWCRVNKKGKEAIKEFQKSKEFLKPISSKLLAIKLSHIPTKDLYYISSCAKDRKNRSENVGGFILGSIKPK